MNEQQLTAQLRREGFSHTYVCEDGPNAFYPEHIHPMETAHIILEGEMIFTMAVNPRHFTRVTVAMFPRARFTLRKWARTAAAT
jgi:hypothetical protein